MTWEALLDFLVVLQEPAMKDTFVDIHENVDLHANADVHKNVKFKKPASAQPSGENLIRKHIQSKTPISILSYLLGGFELISPFLIWEH